MHILRGLGRERICTGRTVSAYVPSAKNKKQGMHIAAMLRKPNPRKRSGVEAIEGQGGKHLVYLHTGQ